MVRKRVYLEQTGEDQSLIRRTRTKPAMTQLTLMHHGLSDP